MAHPFHRAAMHAHRVVARPLSGRRRLVLVIGVMRSGSSLLTNVLADNPAVCGFGESHIDYHDERAVSDLVYWLFRFTHRYPRRSDLLLDKVLHAKHLPDIERLARHTDLKVVFLLRGPAANSRSLATLFERNPNGRLGVDDYLVKRYAEIAELAAVLPAEVPACLMTYEELTQHTEEALTRLTRFLGLETRLSASYDVPKWSGRWGLGDGSDNIRSGTILPQTTGAPGREVPPAVERGFERLVGFLAERCGDG